MGTPPSSGGWGRRTVGGGMSLLERYPAIQLGQSEHKLQKSYQNGRNVNKGASVCTHNTYLFVDPAPSANLTL